MKDIMHEWELAKKRAADIYRGSSEVIKKDIKPVEQVVASDKLYNIYKRSLPVSINKIVYFNVDLKTANMLCDKILQTKSYHDHSTNTKTLIYYDIEPVDAKPTERNLFLK